MKATIGTLILVFVSLASFSKDKKDDLKIISIKDHTVYFKVAKEFVGGTVEVFDTNMTIIECEDLPHTHTMVYFDEVPDGYYIIKVTKGNKVARFKYFNTWVGGYDGSSLKEIDDSQK